MRKAFKIILAIFAVLIIAFVAFAAVIFLDVAAYTATGSQTLTPTGTSAGNALVAYDPGLSGAAKNVANEIATDLQAQGYTVTLAGIKSSAAASTSNFSIIVVGGPVYAGTPTGSVKDFVHNLNLQSGTKLGVFGSGSGAQEGNDVETISNAVSAPSGAVIIKIGQNENLTQRAADFVTQLMSPSLGMLP
jgi:flavodoxin